MRAALFAGLVLACGLRAAAHDPITTKVTWSKEIVRIVTARCAGCHMKDGVAPMPLTSFEDARPWAKAIKAQVVSRRMPRWPAARGFGEFENDASLSPFEIAVIAAWVDGGAPKGNARDAPKPARALAAHRPDVTLKLPKRNAPPSGQRQVFAVPTHLTNDRWISGWRFTPSDAAIVQAEFSIEGVGYLGNWVPPERELLLPGGAGAAMPAKAVVTVTVWYRDATAQQNFPVARPGAAPVLDLFLSAAPPSRVVQHLDAPCGRTTTAIQSGELLGFRPVSARSGESIGVALRSPAGTTRPLAWIREFDPGYQVTYRPREHMALAPGTTLEVDGGGAECRVLVEYLARSESRGVTGRAVRPPLP